MYLTDDLLLRPPVSSLNQTEKGTEALVNQAYFGSKILSERLLYSFNTCVKLLNKDERA